MSITVACVLRSGGAYTPEYVQRLKDGVDRHLTGHRFVCLSDVDVPCDRMPLERKWPGWWAKVELLKLTGRVLYLDLDTVIVGDLTEIAEHPHRFTMLSDFYRPHLPASGVMAWDGDYSHIFRGYGHGQKYGGHGDQGYIGGSVEADRFQDLFPGQIVSRKQRAKRNPNERIVCFHGQPRPHEVGWAV